MLSFLIHVAIYGLIFFGVYLAMGWLESLLVQFQRIAGALENINVQLISQKDSQKNLSELMKIADNDRNLKESIEKLIVEQMKENQKPST